MVLDVLDLSICYRFVRYSSYFLHELKRFCHLLDILQVAIDDNQFLFCKSVHFILIPNQVKTLSLSIVS